IAALHGIALGGGLELALAAHYRIAEANATLGLPEVTLGLLPGAGGTQRLPRLVGAASALRLILTGQPVQGSEALALGLVDRVVGQDLTEAAVAMAAEGLAVRRSCDLRRGFMDMAGYQSAVTAARATLSALPAPARIVDCIEAAGLLPFDQGLLMEQSAFADLVAAPEAAGLRHAFFVERRAAVPPHPFVAKGNAPVAHLALWGGGDMAADLAFQALSAGLHVIWGAADRAVLVQSLGRTAARQELAVATGLVTEEQRDEDWARLTTALDPAALAGQDLVLISPDADALAVSLDLVSGLGVVAGLGAVMAGQAAAGQGGPDCAITVPYETGGLAELSLRPGAAPETVTRLTALARALGWRLVFAGPGGPIELHLRQALSAAAVHLVGQGMEAQVVAAVQTQWQARPGGAAPVATPRQAAEITATSLAAMAAEGSRMVQDGRARRPLDVDAVALLAGLLPRWMGGPMFQADQRGLLVLRSDLRSRAPHDPIFAPAALMDDLISQGQMFASLNTGQPAAKPPLTASKSS
ncbi:MAG: enoyl-CoA hydratase/isomerase family protein, partial [Candidatus Saccharibacteria bacterium]|nr:enoyl-CoA hydratase/isomerase family protein [Pseudorhodobacter sp.]